MPKLFGREPSLWIGLIGSAVSVVASLNSPWLTGEQAALIVVALNALLGALNAAMVRPVSPIAFTYVVGALASLAAAYGFEVSEATVGAINGLFLAGLSLLARGQVSPQNTSLSKS